MTQHKIKEIIGKTVEECRKTWLITPRELQEVLISLAGDLAVEESQLTEREHGRGEFPASIHSSIDFSRVCPRCGKVGYHHVFDGVEHCPKCGKPFSD